MKTSEVFATLEQNPFRKFKHDIDQCFYAILSVDDEFMEDEDYFAFFELNIYEKERNSQIVSTSFGAGGFNGNISINAQWEEILDEVSYEEAIEAWLCGKIVECVVTYDPCASDTVNTKRITLGTDKFFGVEGNYLDKFDFKNGKWYILD